MNNPPPEPVESPAARIMVVDDESALSHLTRLTLERFGGYQVCEVNHSPDAIATAGTFHPDLILMDVNMPVIDGGELAVQFREHPSLGKIPIIFLTSMVHSSEAGDTGLISNNRRFLSKPINREFLLAAIREVLAEKGPA